MSNVSKDFYDCLELLIKDENKKSRSDWCVEGRLPKLTHNSGITFERVAFSKPGHFEYYGVGYELFGAKDLAFYKSSNGDIYFIESLNSVPYRHHKIIEIL